MTLSTEQKIISAARECFFRHGFKASNMTLISEYAGFSRATVHKYASNKDDAFRKVCEIFISEAQAASTPIIEQNLDCWQTIEKIIQVWIKPSFDEVSDTRILNDLKYHVQHVAEDIFKDARQVLEQMIAQQLRKGIEHKQLSLSAIGLSEQSLAQLMIASLDGLRGHYEKAQLNEASEYVIKVYKLACQSK